MGYYAWYTSEFNCLFISGVKEFDPPIKRPEKRFFLVANDLGNLIGVFLQAGEGLAQGFDHGGNKLEKYRALHGHRLVGDTQRAAEDSPQDIAASLVTRSRPVRQGDSQTADMPRSWAMTWVRSMGKP